MYRISSPPSAAKILNILFFLACFSLGLVFYGAIPFYTTPTLGQAVGTTVGWALSFLNDGNFSIYATHFGYPEPAARSFGLMGVLTCALFIKAGIHGADAYTLMAIVWLGVAFVSAYKMARHYSVGQAKASLLALMWISMPIVTAHTSYSMLSLGIALLPFYFLVAMKLFMIFPDHSPASQSTVLAYFATTLIAVFMDGYTYMMFATGSSILLAWQYLHCPQLRSLFLRKLAPIHFAAFATSYLVYALYIGRAAYSSHSLDFFRGWGLDLSFVVMPTAGIHWLADLLGLSVKRSGRLFYGDASVYITTFMLPVLLLGLLSWCSLRKRIKLASALLVISLFSFWMAMGPSVKINSIKPEGYTLSDMPKKHALMSSGNQTLSKHLPGFTIMRAAYRWSALTFFSLWLLVVINISKQSSQRKALWLILVLCSIVINAPHIGKILKQASINRSEFMQIDKDLVAPLKQHLKQNDLVAFIPYGNDLTINYAAPAAGIRTFNIGGDKNLSIARVHWPAEMQQLGAPLTMEKVATAKKMLLDNKADALIVPYFGTLATNFWRCRQEPKASHRNNTNPLYVALFGNCPRHRAQKYAEFVSSFRDSLQFSVVDTENFTIIKLKPDHPLKE